MQTGEIEMLVWETVDALKKPLTNQEYLTLLQSIADNALIRAEQVQETIRHLQKESDNAWAKFEG